MGRGHARSAAAAAAVSSRKQRTSLGSTPVQRRAARLEEHHGEMRHKDDILRYGDLIELEYRVVEGEFLGSS